MVTQLGDIYTPGSAPHKCVPKCAALPAARIQAQIRETANSETFTPASSIVNDALQANLTHGAPTEAIPHISSLVRQTNRTRQKNRPPNPTDLKFTIQDTAIPTNFLSGDIKLNNQRHIMFYTDNQLELLQKAKEWYVDGTFKCIGHPFSQLWTIHAFLRHEDSIKQVPLIFVFMSSKTIADHNSVLHHLLTKFTSPPSVTAIILDFEIALWTSIRQTLPNVHLQGCGFHWGQSLWRKVQELGLAVTYQTNATANKFIRRLFSLPFMPADAIEPPVDNIQALDTHTTPMAPPLRKLIDYIQDYWVHTTKWPTSNWSVYNRSIRTNNDCEGWHRRVNSKVRRHHLPFYQLVEFLHQKATLVTLQAQLVAEDKLKRDQRSRFKKQQGKIFDLWDRYQAKELDVNNLFREISKVHRPPTRL